MYAIHFCSFQLNGTSENHLDSCPEQETIFVLHVPSLSLSSSVNVTDMPPAIIAIPPATAVPLPQRSPPSPQCPQPVQQKKTGTLSNEGTRLKRKRQGKGGFARYALLETSNKFTPRPVSLQANIRWQSQASLGSGGVSEIGSQYAIFYYLLLHG